MTAPVRTSLQKKVPKAGLITIISSLTLAAIGSEINCGGVISNMELNKKVFFSKPALRLVASILDPTYIYSCLCRAPLSLSC